MSLVREVEEAIKKAQPAHAGDPQFVRLAEFMREMDRLGLVVRKRYELPPLDTVGKFIAEADVTRAS